jgi:hypothetical protein
MKRVIDAARILFAAAIGAAMFYAFAVAVMSL